MRAAPEATAVGGVGIAAAVEMPEVSEGAVPVETPIAPVNLEQVHVSMADRLRRMQEDLELPEEYITDLLRLVGTDIVVIADDSGSMNSVSDAAGVGREGLGLKTRWQELQQTLRMLVSMLLVVDHSEGFWLKFLNDSEWYKITSIEQLEDIFASKPRAKGKTPLLANLQPVMSGYGAPERDTLLLILTDGEPSDCAFDELSSLIRAKPSDVFCSFAMCTDESDVVDLYNKVVDPIPGCDITDDYSAECREAQRVGNTLSPFQWLAKMLLCKYAKYDKLDECRVRKRRSWACCVLS